MPDDSNLDDSPDVRVVYRSPASAWGQEERDDFSFFSFLNVLLRHRGKVIGLPIGLAVLLVVGTLLWPDSYTTTASFMPQTGTRGGQLSQLAGVASQFGVDVPTQEASQSPQFYARLVRSRRILREVATTTYSGVAGEDTIRANLIRIYDIGPTSGSGTGAGMSASPEDLEDAVDELEENVSVSSNAETGVVELGVTSSWPWLSKQIADRIIEGVNRFNLEVRQLQASAEAEFVGERLEEARTQLRVAEDSLENFLQRNVGWQQSPELRFRHDRLQRQVSRKQQVYTSLATRYEEARINEVRNTPVITNVTPPVEPAEPDSGRIPLKVALGLVLGGMVGVVWAFGAEAAEDARQDSRDEFREFVSLKKDAAADLKRIGRRIRGLVGDGSQGGET